MDEVIIFTPYWVSFPDFVSVTGAKPVFVSTNPDMQFEPNFKELKSVINSKTKGIIINSPKAIGSLRLEMFLESKKIEFKNRYDICLISEYFSNPKGSYGRKLKFHIEQMNDFLSRYIKKNNKSIAINKYKNKYHDKKHSDHHTAFFSIRRM